MAIPTGRSRLSLAQQALALRSTVCGCRCSIRGSCLVCIADLQPSPWSRTYTVRIAYEDGNGLKVTVVNPPLERRPGQAVLPHTYGGTDLCLHLPEEWRPSMLIAHTVVPWCSEWLFHYELWLATGDWTGGGHDPSSK
jgi:hypothetical protein